MKENTNLLKKMFTCLTTLFLGHMLLASSIIIEEKNATITIEEYYEITKILNKIDGINDFSAITNLLKNCLNEENSKSQKYHIINTSNSNINTILSLSYNDFKNTASLIEDVKKLLESTNSGKIGGNVFRHLAINATEFTVNYINCENMKYSITILNSTDSSGLTNKNSENRVIDNKRFFRMRQFLFLDPSIQPLALIDANAFCSSPISSFGKCVDNKIYLKSSSFPFESEIAPNLNIYSIKTNDGVLKFYCDDDSVIKAIYSNDKSGYENYTFLGLNYQVYNIIQNNGNINISKFSIINKSSDLLFSSNLLTLPQWYKTK